MDFWDCNFLKTRIFHFSQFLMHQNKFQGILQQISRHVQVHFQNIHRFIWPQALSNKLCRFKNQKKRDFLQFLLFHFELTKQLCDS